MPGRQALAAEPELRLPEAAVQTDGSACDSPEPAVGGSERQDEPEARQGAPLQLGRAERPVSALPRPEPAFPPLPPERLEPVQASKAQRAAPQYSSGLEHPLAPPVFRWEHPPYRCR